VEGPEGREGEEGEAERLEEVHGLTLTLRRTDSIALDTVLFWVASTSILCVLFFHPTAKIDVQKLLHYFTRTFQSWYSTRPHRFDFQCVHLLLLTIWLDTIQETNTLSRTVAMDMLRITNGGIFAWLNRLLCAHADGVVEYQEYLVSRHIFPSFVPKTHAVGPLSPAECLRA
jgi:hypothetical protein